MRSPTLALATVAMLFGAQALAAAPQNPAAAPQTPLGKKVENFTLRDYHGQPHSLDEARGNPAPHLC